MSIAGNVFHTAPRKDRFMVFKKMLRAMGVGGPSVETVLANASDAVNGTRMRIVFAVVPQESRIRPF